MQLELKVGSPSAMDPSTGVRQPFRLRPSRSVCWRVGYWVRPHSRARTLTRTVDSSIQRATLPGDIEVEDLGILHEVTVDRSATACVPRDGRFAAHPDPLSRSSRRPLKPERAGRRAATGSRGHGGGDSAGVDRPAVVEADVVEQAAVVADQQQGAVVGGQRLLQLLDGRQIEVVGGLVENQ